MRNSKDTKENDDKNIIICVQQDQKQRDEAETNCTVFSFKFFLVNKAKHKMTR